MINFRVFKINRIVYCEIYNQEGNNRDGMFLIIQSINIH
jgi:hypothetical protein